MVHKLECRQNATLTGSTQKTIWERSGSVVDCLTWDWGAAGSSLTGVTVLCPWARHINPSLVLVQPRKTCPYIIERLLMGCKESNQTKNKNNMSPPNPSERETSWSQMKINLPSRTFLLLLIDLLEFSSLISLSSFSNTFSDWTFFWSTSTVAVHISSTCSFTFVSFFETWKSLYNMHVRSSNLTFLFEDVFFQPLYSK